MSERRIPVDSFDKVPDYCILVFICPHCARKWELWKEQYILCESDGFCPDCFEKSKDKKSLQTIEEWRKTHKEHIE